MTDLIEELAQFTHDPLGFVLFAFPWGEPGSELEEAEGPEDWQAAFLKELGDRLRSNQDLSEAIAKVIQMARTSGHGVGKSALVSWVILWAMSTFEDTRGVVTANTENQLKTKTWVELATWHRRFIAREYFNLTATALFANDPEHERTWRIDMVPWSERNTEAFAGLHNKGKRIVVIFDEASGIADPIWETTEGALTDKNTEIIWATFGNPNRNKGRFRECFPGGKFAHRWSTDVVDSREVRLTDKAQIAQWIEDYGEDHDFVRVRVRGIFPRVDAESFISLELAREAAARDVEPQLGHPVVLGVDVGRFGDDASVLYPRKGRDARSIQPKVFFGIDTMALAAEILRFATEIGASIVVIDEGGVGGGVVDRCRQLRLPVFGVDFGSKADGWNEEDTPGIKYANKRAEIWGALKAWLPRGAIIEAVPGLEVTLVDELTGPNFGMNTKEEIQLESKKEMRKRGVPSPNMADALACTFAFPTYQPKTQEERDEQPHVVADYNPFSKERMAA